MQITQRAPARPEWSDWPSLPVEDRVDRAEAVAPTGSEIAIRMSGSNATARLDEDADTLFAEAARLLNAAETVAASALLEGDHASIVDALGHVITCSRRARHLLSAAVHLDLTKAAS
jgi:hypothetical protein